MDYLCRCRRFLYSRLFYYLKRIHGQPPWSHLFQCTFCHVRQSVPRKPTRNLLYQLLQWCKPGKQTAIPISSSLGQNDKAQLPVNIPHSIRWNKNSQRCVFSCLVGIYAPKATTDRRIIYYCTESGQSLAMSKQDRESLIIRFNASMKCNRLLRQEKIHYYLSPLPWCIPSAKIKEWLPAKYFLNTCFSSACKHSKNYIMLFRYPVTYEWAGHKRNRQPM